MAHSIPPAGRSVYSLARIRHVRNELQRSSGNRGGSESPQTFRAVIALVDWWAAICFNSNQLHRPADPLSPRSISEAGISLVEHRLRKPRNRISCCLFHRTDCLRKIHGSCGNSAWTVYQCRILFTSFNADAARSGSRQFCFLPISFGSRRIGELACCDQSGLGVVSETRARTSDCAFRQWIIGWRRHLTVHRFVDLFPVGVASSVYRPRIARIGMGNGLAALLLSSRATSAHL